MADAGGAKNNAQGEAGSTQGCDRRLSERHAQKRACKPISARHSERAAHPETACYDHPRRRSQERRAQITRIRKISTRSGRGKRCRQGVSKAAAGSRASLDWKPVATKSPADWSGIATRSTSGASSGAVTSGVQDRPATSRSDALDEPGVEADSCRFLSWQQLGVITEAVADRSVALGSESLWWQQAHFVA